jgi:hypothetical protein
MKVKQKGVLMIEKDYCRYLCCQGTLPILSTDHGSLFALMPVGWCIAEVQVEGMLSKDET